MIEKMTSNELNNILTNANNKLETLTSTIQSMKENMIQKLKILKYESEYIELNLNSIKNDEGINYSNDKIILFDENFSEGLNKFGCTTLAKFKNIPLNVFNIRSIETDESFYRDIADISINDVTKDEYKGILMHDNISNKKIFFDEYNENNNEVKITIKTDYTKTIGKTTFNIIEIDSFLNGSYDIKTIKIYNSQNNDFYDEITDFKYAGKMRISLDKEYELNKIEIIIKLNYYTMIDNKKIFPFGLKHIYFYKAQYMTNSYAVAIIKSSDYIDTIENNILIKTPNKLIETTIENEDIKLYLGYKVDEETGEMELTNEQLPTTSQDTRPISINVNKIYAKVPLSDKSVIGINFKTTSKSLDNL